MKKVMALILAAIFAFSLVGCTNQPVTSTTEPTQTAAVSQTPDATLEAETTQTPEATDDVQTTDTPEESTAPDATDTPEESAAPDATNTPAESADPNATESTGAEDKAFADMTLEEIMAAILTDVADLPSVGDVPLDSENFEFYAFIPMPEGGEGLASDALIGSIAHSVVLVRVAEGTDAQQTADEIKANADPRKWICVEAEKCETAVRDDVVLLVMSNEQTADAILANFEALK